MFTDLPGGSRLQALCGTCSTPVSAVNGVWEVQGLKDRGYTLQDNEAEQLVSHLDTDYSGQVDYLDWLAAMIDWHKVCTSHTAALTGKASHDKLKFGHYLEPHIAADMYSKGRATTW